MGLESLPDLSWAPKQRTTLESILRSRSVNSVDFFPEFDSTCGHHRRVRTSVSFREIPTFLQQQKQDFFVLCFEKVAGSRKMCLSVRESEVGLEEPKRKEAWERRSREGLRERKPEKREKQERKKKGSERQEDQIRKSCSKLDKVNLQKNKSGIIHRLPKENLKARTTTKPMNQKKSSVESKAVTNKKRSKTAGDKRKACSNPGRSFTNEDNAVKAKRKSEEKAVTKSRESHCYVEQLGQICRMAEEDIKVGRWVAQKVANFEDIEEICGEFEKQFLDLLLEQVVVELLAFEISCFWV